MKLTFWEVAQAVEASNDWQQWPDFPLTGIEFDSRKIVKGNLFVPLQGENDGHRFIESAMANGCQAAFWGQDLVDAPQQLPVLHVTDPLVAMQKLATYYLNKMQPNVIAVTGSNGKTTTKDLIAAVLSEKFVTYKTQGNYNNQIGLPYTILHMPDETEKLILEMGMDHAQEISFLSNLAQPEVAAITMIGEAHVENLGSRAGIAQAKMEIIDGLAKDGSLFVPSDEPLLEPLVEKVTQQVITFGFSQESQLQGIVTNEAKEQTSFKISDTQMTFTIPVPGTYNVTNALIAIGIGRYFQLTDSEIQKGLATAELTKNRTEWLKAANGAEILSDVYNANPTAMGLVLDSFSKMSKVGKRIAVLGDMLELGPDSAAMHQAMAQHLAPDAIEEVFLYGSEMAYLADKLQETYAPANIHSFKKEEKNELIEAVKKVLQPEDMVVLKGSNGMGLREVIDALLEK